MVESKRLVLIVEDNEMNRDMLARRLKRKGFELVIAENGEVAIALARSERPQLILMDMSLPVLDGWEATRRLKGDPETQQIPIIALTAHAMENDKKKAFAAGCDEFESKPVRFAQLLEKIESLILRG